MDLGLTGKVALVAGGGRGIGRAVALALAREGADVAVLARTRGEVEATARDVQAMARRAIALVADLTDPAQLTAALERLEASLGAPTLLVLSAAAMWEAKKLQFVEPTEVASLIQADLTTAVSLCQRVLPGMMTARFGRIVALGSSAARFGVSGGTLYATTKAGIEGLMRGIALDYSRRGITANTASFGFVETERLSARLKNDRQAREQLTRHTARRALVSPEEAADAVVFLCSARAGAISGTVLEVTAGGHLNTLW